MLEDDALCVAFAFPLRFDAIVAYWLLFTTFDAPLATRYSLSQLISYHGS